MIKVKNLTKKFDDFVAVKNISFEVKKGEMFAFLGPNGAGKSTTIKIFTTLLRPTSGQVKINGFNIEEEEGKVRKSFGIVFQDQSLDDQLTAWENMDFHGVIYGIEKKQRRQRIRQFLKLVDLYDRKDSLVKEFSGGMKRRLEMARGLLHQPTILFLDEPTLGLDPQTRNHIWEYIKKLNQTDGLTVFFTTHYMEEAERYASRIAVIDHGEIKAIGNLGQLKEITASNSLEQVFLKLTGYDIRDEKASGLDRMRQQAKRWGR